MEQIWPGTILSFYFQSFSYTLHLPWYTEIWSIAQHSLAWVMSSTEAFLFRFLLMVVSRKMLHVGGGTRWCWLNCPLEPLCTVDEQQFAPQFCQDFRFSLPLDLQLRNHTYMYVHMVWCIRISYPYVFILLWSWYMPQAVYLSFKCGRFGWNM